MFYVRCICSKPWGAFALYVRI